MKKAGNCYPEDESDREMMNECQAALFLGTSTKSLRGLRQKNQIPHGYVGKQIRYLRSKLIQWIADGGSNQTKESE